MDKPWIIRITLTIIASGLISGCVCVQEKNAGLDQNWGVAFETAFFSQRAFPDPGNAGHPVEGLDGEAARLIIEKYRTEFSEQSDSNRSYSGLKLMFD